MNCTGLQGITVLDFHLALGSRTTPADCRGPIAYLDLSEQVVDRIASAMLVFGRPELLQDKVIAATSKKEIRCGSCAAHWLDLAAITSVVGQTHQRRDFHLIATLLMKQVCSSVGWDYRELSNYMASKASAGSS